MEDQNVKNTIENDTDNGLIDKYNNSISALMELRRDEYWGIILQLINKRNNVMVSSNYSDTVDRKINVNTNITEYAHCVLCGERKQRANMNSIDFIVTDKDDIADIFDILSYGVQYMGPGSPLTLTSCKDHSAFEHLSNLIYSGSFSLKDVIELRRTFQ